MRHWRCWIAVAVWACLVDATAALGQDGRPVRVTVRDSSGAPLPDALVSWMPSGVHARSNTEGVAYFPRILFGPEVLTVRRLGYERLSAPLAIDTLEPDEVTVILRRSMVQLGQITVHDTASLPWLKAFDERRRRGRGRFVTMDKINSAHGGSLGALLQRTVPGIRVGVRSPVEQYIFSTRGPNSVGSADCQAAVYVDGVRDPKGNVAEFPLMMVGGIEYYPPGEVPVEYKVPATVGIKGGAQGGTPACGVLLMWTR